VEWVPGATPTAYFIDQNGNEVSQVVLGDKTLTELLVLFEENHFQPSVTTLNYGEPIAVKEYAGHTYKFFNVENPKDIAADFARSLNGYIATITNQNEQNFLGQALKELQITKAWLGGADSEEEGNWKWSEGPEKGVVFWSSNPESNIGAFTLWFTGEPNDIDSEDCGIFFPDGWNDVTCSTEKAPLVVEFGNEPLQDVPYAAPEGTTTTEPASVGEAKPDL